MRDFPPCRLSVFVAAILFCTPFFSVRNVCAVQPQVGNHQPSGIQSNATIDWKVTGKQLADAQEILFFSPGFTVSELTAENETTLKMKLSVAADVPFGIHAFRVRTASGVSNLRTLTVGPFADVAEKEPNNDFAKPQVVENRNVTLSGIIQNEDVDYFLISAKKGERISAELEGLRLGTTLFDPYLALLNEDRYEIARSDDAPLLNQDCLLSVVVPEDGNYVLQVRESTFGGSGAADYRLHLGDFPRPVAVYPAGGRPGEKLALRMIGDAAGDFTQEVTLPSSGSTFSVFARRDQGVAPSPNVIRVIDLPNVLEAEPNNEAGQAASASPVPVAFNGIIEQTGDRDFFRFAAKKGMVLDIRVFARQPLRSPLDAVLTIHGDKGNQLAANDDANNSPDSYLRFNVPNDGDYLLSVSDQLREGGPHYVYRVEIAPPAPSLALTIPERQQYISTTLTIPRNNRMALLVSATRTNAGGPLKIELPGLPPEVTVETLPLGADSNETAILFHAAAGATNRGLLQPLIVKTEDPNSPLQGELQQRTMLVRGPNNREFWGYSSDRLAAVVTDEIPYRIELIQPQAPLARSGSLPLKVVAQRAGDFKAPITLRLLSNPGGTSSSTSIVIPEGQSEGIIPLTASPTAALGKWKVVALATAPHGGGTVECSSSFAEVQIVDQYYAFTFDRPAVELGKETQLTIKVEKKADFDGEATAELLGLPAGTTSSPVKFTKDATEIVFAIKADAATARPGKHGGIVCQTVFQVNGEPVTHTLGKTDLRVDQPLPPKPNAPAVAAKPATPPAAGTPAKPLSRLEQLRLEQTGGK